ncbi:MAG TPA: DMT family transporter [Usitatibacter sp.]|jgi:drug/metabolite transporter (DMT)-like permease|nr:DMT family transporter [Usitatibacter sp.]
MERTRRVTAGTAALLTLPPLLWAGNAIVGSLVVGRIPPLTLNALRWILALILLLPLGWRVIAHPRALLARWRYFASVGFFGIGCYNAFQYMALATSSPINVTLIAASASVFMLLIGWIGYRVRPRAAQVLGAALSLAGVAFVLARGTLSALLALRFVPGDLFMLLASLAWSLYSWQLARPPASMAGTQRPAWNWAELLTAQLVFGATWGAIASAVELAILRPVIPWSPGIAGALAYVAIGPAVAAYWAWGRGVSLVGPTLAALFSNFTPLFAAVLSLALLGEAPRWYHGVAFVLIATGVAIPALRAR